MKQGLKTDRYIFRELPPTSHSYSTFQDFFLNKGRAGSSTDLLLVAENENMKDEAITQNARIGREKKWSPTKFQLG